MIDSKSVIENIIPFIYVLNKNSEDLQKMTNLVLMHEELLRKHGDHPNSPNEENVKNISYLMNSFGIFNFSIELIGKYLVNLS